MEFSRNMDKEDIEYLKFIMEYGDGYSPLLLQSAPVHSGIPDCSAKPWLLLRSDSNIKMASLVILLPAYHSPSPPHM